MVNRPGDITNAYTKSPQCDCQPGAHLTKLCKYDNRQYDLQGNTYAISQVLTKKEITELFFVGREHRCKLEIRSQISGIIR